MRKVYEFTEIDRAPIPAIQASPDSFSPTPSIIIDYGSLLCRAGFNCFADPKLQFETISGKSRDKETLVGNEIHYAGVYSTCKTAFDESGIITNAEVLENSLDYIFHKLNIQDDHICFPIVMTEPLCNTKFSRKLASELMFEVYNASSLCFGIDSAFSFYENQHSMDLQNLSGLVINGGHLSTQIVPIIDGNIYFEGCKRISYGGYQMADYMLNLVQHKYPTFPHRLTTSHTMSFVQNHAKVSSNYIEDLRDLASNKSIIDAETHVIQFPYDSQNFQELEEKHRKRVESGKRLQEYAALKRAQRLQEKESKVADILLLKEERSSMTVTEYKSRLEKMSITGDLDEEIQKLEKSIEKARNKALGIQSAEPVKETPVFDLLDIPETELTEQQIKQKRIQKMMKGSMAVREKMKRNKEEQKRRDDEIKRKDEELRNTDLKKWLMITKKKREDLASKLKSKVQLKQQLSDRRSAASFLRRKTIASLAGDDDSAVKGRTRQTRSGSSSTSSKPKESQGIALTPEPKRKRKKAETDDFGADDEDWDVYREISRDDESDDDTQDASEIYELDTLISQYDPSYIPTAIPGSNSDSLLQYLSSNPSKPNVDLDANKTLAEIAAQGEYEAASEMQIHLNVERKRVTEVLFQPGIIGIEQAGVVELVKDLFARVETGVGVSLAKNICITGGLSKLPGIQERIFKDITSIRPYGSIVNVYQAKDPINDAWKGARKWTMLDQVGKYFVTRAEYEEFGGEYLKEHGFGNLCGRVSGRGVGDEEPQLPHHIMSVLEKLIDNQKKVIEYNEKDPATFISIASLDDIKSQVSNAQAAKNSPLYGLTLAVKDNIDVKGFNTTAACPKFAYTPTDNAYVVSKLSSAGMIIIGKTNLDQFATGLVGTRSPYGTPKNPIHPLHIPGGSSSGSAVAVSSHLCDASLGTDTAGSGRVPAAFQSIIGIKPTRGLLSTAGVFPACKSLDCVSVFARDMKIGRMVFNAARGFNRDDEFSRVVGKRGLRKSKLVVLGVPKLDSVQDHWFGDKLHQEAYYGFVKRVSKIKGVKIVPVDVSPYLKAAKLLYEGPWVAERFAVLAEFLKSNGGDVLPVTKSIVLNGNKYTAVDVFQAMYTLQKLKRQAEFEWEKMDFMVVPTTPTIHTLDEVEKDNVGCNTRLGTYTNFCNLLDLCAIAIPAVKRRDGLSMGITLYGKAGADDVLMDFAERMITNITITAIKIVAATHEMIITGTLNAPAAEEVETGVGDFTLEFPEDEAGDDVAPGAGEEFGSTAGDGLLNPDSQPFTVQTQ
ncbi:hypothetical protein HK098_006274 [Nowakowskiella sp. JEL0407]|nr:hypothetical protein HK098_006274 [Nowakowskiella sp. JEL0407]